MSRLLERETSPPRIRTERTLYRLSCRGSSRKREKERDRRGGRTRTKEVFRAIFFRKKNRVRVFHERFSFLPFRRCCVDGVWIPPRPEPFLHDFSDSHSRGFTLSRIAFLIPPLPFRLVHNLRLFVARPRLLAESGVSPPPPHVFPRRLIEINAALQRVLVAGTFHRLCKRERERERGNRGWSAA